jgi:copper homeostasis protein CutC
MARSLGVDGVVIGALQPDGSIDVKTLDNLVSIAKGPIAKSNNDNKSNSSSSDVMLDPLDDDDKPTSTSTLTSQQRQPEQQMRPMMVTFHRAFDVCRGDPLEDLIQLESHGVDYLLTSGKVTDNCLDHTLSLLYSTAIK